MGGLRRKLPIPFFCMLVGAAALAALPLTSGFYSKDVILLTSFDYGTIGPWFWIVASLAAFVTSLYSARMIFLVFFGTEKTEPHDHSGWNMTLPLLVLAVLALGGGWFGLAAVAPVLPDGGVEHGEHAMWLVWLTALIPIAGVALGCVLYGLRGTDSSATPSRESGVAPFLRSGWGFDGLYDTLLVKPFFELARLMKSDPVNAGYSALVIVSRFLHKITAVTQTGQLRWYAASMGLGFAVVLILAVIVV